MKTTVYGGRLPHNGTDTSVAAAARGLHSAEALRQQIYDLIRTAPNGLTDWDIQIATGRLHQSVTARRRELVLMDKVRDSGRRDLSPSNRKIIVWEVCDG